jgi:glycosyltransferase involved in cell wall biosynthesis
MAEINPSVSLACLGDANDPQAWSSIPYHLLEEGRCQGVIQRGIRLRLNAPSVQLHRLLWNTSRLLSGHASGGFQYCQSFLDRLWAGQIDELRGGSLISNFQILPAAVVADPTIQRWFYLDGTLQQLTEYYGAKMDRRWFVDVWAREKQGYHSAAGVLAMSSFCAASLVNDYGVPRDRIHIVLPGANLTASSYSHFEPELEKSYARRIKEIGDRGRALRLVFIGRSFARKGLDRLLSALALGRARGLRMTLRVIGLSREQVPARFREIGGVEWLGVISRRTNTDRFCRAVAECDIGCLLSRAEMAGISIREALAMGQPVIGPATGGSPDLMPTEASWMVSPNDSDEKICDLLLEIERDMTGFELKREAAWKMRRDMLWGPAVHQIRNILASR